MTSLEELCRTEDEKAKATKLLEHGLLTDRDILLADDVALKGANITKRVPELSCLFFCDELGIGPVLSKCYLLRHTTN
jgi:hypothetical protein